MAIRCSGEIYLPTSIAYEKGSPLCNLPKHSLGISRFRSLLDIGFVLSAAYIRLVVCKLTVRTSLFLHICVSSLGALNYLVHLH